MDESYYDCWKILLRPLQSWAWGLKSSVHRGGFGLCRACRAQAGHFECRVEGSFGLGLESLGFKFKV